MTRAPAIELRRVSKHFGSVIALRDIDMKVYPGEVHCLLGDNGAGKSTLIKILSGVHQPTAGDILIDGMPVRFGSPRDAAEYGVATVFQDLGIIPLMSIARNFFLGREPVKGFFPFTRLDKERANAVARQAMAEIGIDIRDPTQAVGSLSGGERQSVAIARASYRGARVLILDEPTSALGVKQSGVVLRYIVEAARRNLGVIFITHNPNHAYPVGDRFLILNRGRSLGNFAKEEISQDQLTALMAGGQELVELEHELEALTGTPEA